MERTILQRSQQAYPTRNLTLLQQQQHQLVLIVDSTNVCSWIKAGSDGDSQTAYISRRVAMIKVTFGNECYWTSTKINPADCGTRIDPGAEQISPTSQFFNGPDWIPNGMTEAIEKGKIVHMNKYAKLPKNKEDYEDTRVVHKV